MPRVGGAFGPLDRLGAWSRAGFVALTLALAGCSPGDGLDALGVMLSLSGESGGAGATARLDRDYMLDGARQAADLYVPVEGRVEAALVLVPGLAPTGYRDERLVALARALAGKRFAVLVPDIVSFREQRVGAADAQAIASALRALGEEHGGRLGLVAISYAVGPAVLAMLRPELAGRIDFVVAIGGYHDATALIGFFTTGWFREVDDAPWQEGKPNAYGRWVFVHANAERLESAFDRVALVAMARRKLANLEADIADLREGLGPEGRAVMALLDNRDPARVAELIVALPRAIRAEIEALDLARRDLSRLDPRAILIHGRDDPIIPYSESKKLARALSGAKVELVLLDEIGHGRFGVSGPLDGLRLWRAIRAVMARRGRALD
jgi:pimeloyl-ACP methyl ester carboxylesterase